MVALLERADTGAAIDDHTGTFMPENSRKNPLRVGARAGEFIGVAKPGCLDFDQHLALSWAVQLNRFDR